MKAGRLIYLIIGIIIFLGSCKKEHVEPDTIVGTWYVERYSVYGSSVSAYANVPWQNYESVGIFNFNADGTGDYTFDNQKVRFAYSISANTSSNNNGSSSSVNGISISSTVVDADIISIDFNPADITKLTSPIIDAFYRLKITQYKVFSKTKGALRLKGDFSSSSYSYSSSSSSSYNAEFIITKQ